MKRNERGCECGNAAKKPREQRPPGTSADCAEMRQALEVALEVRAQEHTLSQQAMLELFLGQGLEGFEGPLIDALTSQPDRAKQLQGLLDVAAKGSTTIQLNKHARLGAEYDHDPELQQLASTVEYHSAVGSNTHEGQYAEYDCSLSLGGHDMKMSLERDSDDMSNPERHAYRASLKVDGVQWKDSRLSLIHI
eukprot:TRINITY_DN40515_c0_g1_i1.p1 TRINITY_DN40515_c0_g1~~TRINITY_DN40515_c0_g1_i1.p1  ORF type:complete len:193 (-),score=46.45 TRINITY_DN40515_c0_g1_i1:80-658(-)